MPDELERDIWYHLSFTVDDSGKGTTLTASLTPPGHGTPVEGETAAPYATSPQGMVALRTHDGPASFRRVSVQALG